MKSNKKLRILKIIGYFCIVLALCVSGALLFHAFYYESVYVSGDSMNPTLVGGNVEGAEADFGIVDTHKGAINRIKRFDIVSTYYPDERDYADIENYTLLKNAKQKIKRVVALPNETFKIEKSKLYVMKNNKYELVPYTFDVAPITDPNYAGKDSEARTLKDNEYWVLGDNRPNSRDSKSIDRPIRTKDIHGVLVAIEGRGKLAVSEYVCSYCGKAYKTKGTGYCAYCYGLLEAEYTVTSKKYHWPKYY